MVLPETQQPRPDPPDGYPPIRCEACQSALQSPGREAISFLLLDTLTVALVGCQDHLEEFRSVCGHTTRGTADLIAHRPAGGIACPGCRLAPHNPQQPMIPLEDGIIAVLACPTHQTEVIDRFHTGLQTRRQITSSLESPDEGL